MKEILAPYAPLSTLKPVAGDVWIADGPEIRMQAGPLAMPFSTRTTLIRLPDGGLWVHSPIAPDPALFAEIEALGPVRWLVAPNTLHYWWIPDWKARYPAAAVCAPPAVAVKAKRPIAIDLPIATDPPAAWQGAFAQVVLASRIFTEADFFHRSSRTLILADLIENFEMGRVHSLFYRLLIRLGGVFDPDGKMPLDMQAAFRPNRAQVRAAVETMLAWGPERIILAHGRWYEKGAIAELRRAFRWVL